MPLDRQLTLNGREGERGHPAQEHGGLAQVLAADAALGVLLQHHKAEGTAAYHPPEPQVRLQEHHGRVSQALLFSLVCLRRETERGCIETELKVDALKRTC